MYPEDNGPGDSWEPELLRLTGFTIGEVDGEAWWPEVAAAPLEKEARDLREGTYQATGRLTGDDGQENVLRLQLAQGRVDWLQTPNQEPENQEPEISPWRTMGSLESSLPAFIALLQPWLSRVDADFTRMAIGVVARRTVESRESGYRILSKYLPFELPVGSTDFLYQLNRPRESRALGDGSLVNRLQKWSVVSLKRVELTLGQGLGTTGEPGPSTEVIRPTTLGHGCRLELDINTAAEREEPLPKERRVDILEELAELALEIASKGDIP